MKAVGFLIETNNKLVLINSLAYALIWDNCSSTLFTQLTEPKYTLKAIVYQGMLCWRKQTLIALLRTREKQHYILAEKIGRDADVWPATFVQKIDSF